MHFSNKMVHRPFFFFFFLFFSFLFLIIAPSLSAQENYRIHFDYLSPRPGANYVLPEQRIAFRLKDRCSPDLLSQTHVELSGSQSGTLSGRVHLASDEKTVFFFPETSFDRDEEVSVLIRFPEEFNLPDFSYSFATTSLSRSERRAILTSLKEIEINKDPMLQNKQASSSASLKAINDSLPPGFPEITITDWDHPGPGTIFVSPLDYELDRYYLIQLDNHATPVFYREVPPNGAMDFKLQPNGTLTYYLTPDWFFLVLDTRYDVIDTLAGQNGYDADIHELRYYDDMHAFLMCYDPQIVDMSQIVPGGQEDAVVVGLIVQELDENKEVVFQWRSWDHYEITDASNWVDLTGSPIDYVHGNSIEVVSDSALMISSRNMNEVTKINRNTGDIIWRLNGEKTMFAFIPEADSFCMQHSIRLMPDSTNISLFDNGNCHSPKSSSAVEYILDDTAFTCTLVERLKADPDIYGPFMGNTQRKHDGTTINGWGKGIPSVTEFDSTGKVTLQFSFPLLNYRAFKFNWNHSVFSADEDTLDFGMIDYHQPASTTIDITNSHHSDITINRIVTRDTVFNVLTPLPVTIPPGGQASFEVFFDPQGIGSFSDDLTFCWDIHSDTLNQRIAVQVHVSGAGAGKNAVPEWTAAGISVFPIPFSDHLTIHSEKEMIREVRLMNVSGTTVFSEEKLNSKRITLPISIQGGIYILEIMSMKRKIYRGKVVGGE
jgi:hypothetical protein